MSTVSLSQLRAKKTCRVLFVCLVAISTHAFADLDDIPDDTPKKKPAPAKLESGQPDLSSPEKKKPASPNQGTSGKNKKGSSSTGANSRVRGKKPGDNSAAEQKKHNTKAPIRWKADGLKGTRSGKLVELKKNVVVNQADVRMTADRAKIHFNDADEVDRVVAQGNVRVRKKAELAKDQMSARGNEAIFRSAERKVTLKGNAVLWRGGDVVKGKQIDYDLDTGWIKVDRVEGVVAPGDRAP